MAPRKFNRKRKSVPRNKKFAKKGRRTMNVNRALTPFAQRYITKMKYSDVFTLSSALNSGLFYFNLNSIYDPNRSGVGGQPYGHDQLEALYHRYRVINCSYVITAYSGGSVIRVVATPLNETWSSVPSISQACMNPRAKFMIQVPGGPGQKIIGNCNIPSLMGRNRDQYMADDRFQALFGSSPSELAVLAIQGADIGDLSATIQCTITLNYTVECFDPKNAPPS